MIHSVQFDPAVEAEIARLFKAISFSNEKNRRRFEKWAGDELQPPDLSVLQNAFSQLHEFNKGIQVPSRGDAGQVAEIEDLQRERRELLEQLRNLENVLAKDGEGVAAKLLTQYMGILSPFVQYFAICCLLLVGSLFVWAMLNS